MPNRVCLWLFLIASTNPVQAGFIIQPVAASTDMGQSSNWSPDRVQNQSGLSTPYLSGITDFDAYIGSNPSHNSQNFLSNNWVSASGDKTGNFDFDLGGPFTIESLALWNHGGGQNASLNGFTLFADDNNAFSSPISLGSFAASVNNGPHSAVLADVFTFAPTLASYVRMQVTSNHGDPALVSFGEAAFEAQALSAVPEPASLTLVGFGALSMAIGAYRRRKNAPRRSEPRTK